MTSENIPESLAALNMEVYMEKLYEVHHTDKGPVLGYFFSLTTEEMVSCGKLKNPYDDITPEKLMDSFGEQ